MNFRDSNKEGYSSQNESKISHSQNKPLPLPHYHNILISKVEYTNLSNLAN